MTSLCLAVLTVVLAASALAQAPTVNITHDALGPIACGTEVTFTVSYDPADYEGELLGYNFDLSVDPAVLDLASGAVSILWPDGSPVSPIYGEDSVAVDVVLLGVDYLAEAADLFTITCTAVGTGVGAGLIVDSGSLRSAPNGNPIADWTLNNDTVDVDCSAPDTPVLAAEPDYTAGTSNEVLWSAVVDNGADGTVAYNVQIATDGAFASLVDDINGLVDVSYLFEGLPSPGEYFFRVRAIDGLGNASDWSNVESSIQDDSPPISAIPMSEPGMSATGTFDVPWEASDATPGSGVAHVELWYSIDGATAVRYLVLFETSPIAFVRPVGAPDGDYLFITRAVDNAGNVETEAEQAIGNWLVTIDSTPPDAPVLAEEPDFTAGDENTIEWEPVGGATSYRATCVGVGSQIVDTPSATFTGLEDGVTYDYHVTAIDALDNESDPSAVESSTQDANPPASAINDTDNGTTVIVADLELDVEFEDRTEADDADGSGVVSVELFYSANGGVFTSAGSTAIAGASPVTLSFAAPEDGSYEFYTRATDAVGNVEPVPGGITFTINVDTTLPEGVFTINEDAPYTTSADVMLYSAEFPDDVVGVWFTDSDTDVPPPPGDAAWIDSLDPYPWTLVGGEGTNRVYAHYLDEAGNIFSTQDDIVLDTVQPEPVAGFSVMPGHEMITLEFTCPADEDLFEVEIWASLLDSLSGEQTGSSYPEFNDVRYPDSGGAVDGYADAELLATDGDWFLLAEVPVDPEGEIVFVHDADSNPGDWERAVYSYYVFAKDEAGNRSLSSRYLKSTVNYILGDFRPAGAPDGIIDLIDDVTYFAAGYGETELDGDGEPNPLYNNELDIARRYINNDDVERVSSYPWTNNAIDFFDLLELAVNFPMYQGAKTGHGSPETPLLAWYEVDDNTWALGLTEPCNSLKAVSIRASLPEDVTVGVAGHDRLDDVKHLLLNDHDRGLDLGFAVLGENTVMPGSGELFRVTTSKPIDLSEADISVRDAEGNLVAYVMSSEPIVELPEVYSVDNNYPNPFNPQTTIRFALPEAQDVRVDIFDIRGYRVRTLVDESMAAGHHSVIWNGRDQAGRQMASGAYFYRVQAGPMNETRRMLLVK